MLGARARAAEYNAFKAASARQASHEAEEHKLPPKTAPVSLGAFSKTAQPSRNKGAKAWKPFVLDDNDPEVASESSGGCRLNSSTPVSQIGGSHRSNPSIDKSETSLSSSMEPMDGFGCNETPTGPRNQQAMRFGDIETPTGPRNLQAMRFGDIETPTGPRNLQVMRFGDRETPLNPRNPQPMHDYLHGGTIPFEPKAVYAPSSQRRSLANPTPQRVQAHSIISQAPQHGIPQSVHSSPGYFPGPGGFPYLPPADHFAMPYLHVGQVQGGYMAPTDISPSKQENKFAMISQQSGYPAPGMMAPYHHQQSSSGSGMINAPMPPLQTDNSYDPATPKWNRHTHYPAVATSSSQRRGMKHIKSDSICGPSPRQAAPKYFPNGSRSISYPASGPPPPGPPETTHSASSAAVQSTPRKSPATPVNEPYDRNSKMQNFVATQQVLAKTGKTVLRNPELHRLKADSEVPTPTREPRRGPISNMSEPRSDLQTPGSKLQATVQPGLKEAEDTDPAALGSAALRNEFGVGTDDWFELKPVTRDQRLLMNKAMRRCAVAESADAPKLALQNTGFDRHKNLQRWVQPGTTDSHGPRRAVDQIAKEHLTSRLSDTSGYDRGVSSRAVDATIESAGISAVGNIMANMADNPDPSGSGPVGGPSLCTYKPAPEYAIERGRFQSGNTGGTNTSFFEDDTSGFYNAPSRIARDPRFRPPSKEGVKPKAEDDWKPRGDPWTRRRM